MEPTRDSGEPTRLVVELSGREPISGVLSGGVGQGQPFVGWLDLLTALERAQSEAVGSRASERARELEEETDEA